MTDEERYEIKALAFKNMTGMTAPGKHDRACTDSPEERQNMWCFWTDTYGWIIDAALDAVSQLEVDRG